MDTQHLPYRLKSARRKRRLLIKDRDKQLLALDRERQRISKSSDYKTVVPLDEPYQKGWKRLFVLRPEVQRSDKAEFYQQILNTINTIQYHYDQSFKKPKRKGRWHKYYFDELPKLQAIEEYYWGAEKPLFSEEQRACFNKVEFWDESYYRWEYKYVFTQPDLFTIAVLPHMLTTVIIGDALLEQRLAWIDDHIKGFAQENRLRSMKGGWYKYWKSWVYIEKLKNVNPLKNKPKWSWDEEYNRLELPGESSWLSSGCFYFMDSNPTILI